MISENQQLRRDLRAKAEAAETRITRELSGEDSLDPIRVQRIAHEIVDSASGSGLVKGLACAKGCAFCCYMRVEVVAPEAFLIADYLRKRLRQDQISEVRSIAAKNWGRLAPLSFAARQKISMPCPLLQNGCCSVYPVRPMACRTYHSTDVGKCRSDFENGTFFERGDSFLLGVRYSGLAVQSAVLTSFSKAGYDARTYDLNAALDRVLESSTAERRWKAKKKAFDASLVATDLFAESTSGSAAVSGGEG